MVRELNKKRYFIAALLTLFIFTLGLMLGLVIEGKRVQYIQSLNKIEKLDYSSLQLQYAYIDQLSQEKNCDAVSKTFESSVKSLIETSERLENYEQNANLNKEDLYTLKREYILAQLNYWLLAQRTKKICNRDLVTILYFYSTDKECPDCGEQAFILTYLKNEFKDKLLIFALDSTYADEPMIEMLKNQYGITKYPTLVIEGHVFEDLVSKDNILKTICSLYEENIDYCDSYN
ncbi:hypothetical protein COY26_01595 [Candidatus Woesearchaeota archaeon CG_4_10_14_0_2_um_filter_33_10]|nr:MAG: hypothetical protein AUJ83_03920 [Candidatus Woesearchaeota archaeon CG1_02_33_12]PIU72432.1 MAG: hypothetical protein COS79_03015 [Candidatus Woesearchaeota archaeon CG06_land_8_20_14_3_00_33_13]PIZ53567.1 MAG: hypothetical protein COY26_01595 [Candidatus Woesearchaeota archaeon CG_4_10_14_0_2_um_filter_33_10]